MSDNNGIPFNLLTEEEVEELFNAGTLRTEVSEDGIISGGTVQTGHHVPVGVNPISGLGVTDDNMVNDWIRENVNATPVVEIDIPPNKGFPGLLTPIQFFDDNGHPTCYPELTCGKCERCKIRQAAHAYFGGSPNRKVMMVGGAGKTGNLRDYQIPVNSWLTGVMNNPGGFKRGELSMISYPRPSDITSQFRKHLNSPFLYNMEEGWDSLVSKLITMNSLSGLDYVARLTNIPKSIHQISDIEVRDDGSVVGCSIIPNQRVNVGTVGHVDMPRFGDTVWGVISVTDNGITVGGKQVHKFPTPPVKYYFGMDGDHYGDSMSHNGRYGALPSTLEYGYNPLLLKPAKKPKREAWAQAAVDKMIVNKYLEEKYNGSYPLGAMRSPALVHNAKRALKNKGLKEGQSLGELFGKK